MRDIYKLAKAVKTFAIIQLIIAIISGILGVITIIISIFAAPEDLPALLFDFLLKILVLITTILALTYVNKSKKIIGQLLAKVTAAQVKCK